MGRTDNTLGTNAYYFADGNGNITCLTDTNQAVVATYLYGSYGRILSQSGWLANANLYRFSSKEFHVNSGLAYYLYRFYDQNLQRWLNRDPMETDAGQSTYGFALESPVNNYDPFGLATCAQFNKELPSIEGRDPKTKQLLGYLATNRCSFNITCYEGADCAKQGIKAGGVASSPLNYGPGKGTCAIGVCASRLPNAFFFREIVRHELAHCAFYCSNPGVPDTCASHLCSEVYAYGSDGRCSGYPQGSQRYYNCLARLGEALSGPWRRVRRSEHGRYSYANLHEKLPSGPNAQTAAAPSRQSPNHHRRINRALAPPDHLLLRCSTRRNPRTEDMTASTRSHGEGGSASVSFRKTAKL